MPNELDMISVIISTYNRCNDLKKALDSLFVQECDGSFETEILIADNNSSDKTKEIIQSYIPKFNGRLHYIFEPRQGKCYALNNAIEKAMGDIIAFTDDDVIVDKKWLMSIWKCFQEYNCDGIGGRIMPLYPNETPKWIKELRDLVGGPIVCYDYGEDIKIYKKEFILPFVGANMAFKRECFDKVGMFFENIGPGTGSMGDDTEFFKRLEKECMRLYYCGNALVWHKVDKRRMSLKYIAYWYIAQGRYSLLIDKKGEEEKLVRWFGVPRYLIRRIIEQILLLSLKVFNRRAFLELWKKLFRDIGRARQYRVLWAKERA